MTTSSSLPVSFLGIITVVTRSSIPMYAWKINVLCCYGVVEVVVSVLVVVSVGGEGSAVVSVAGGEPVESGVASSTDADASAGKGAGSLCPSVSCPSVVSGEGGACGEGGGGALSPPPPLETPAASAISASSCCLLTHVSPVSSKTQSSFVCTRPAKKSPIPFAVFASYLVIRANNELPRSQAVAVCN